MSTCNTCHRDADRMNGPVSECSHVECPHRRHAWSERPGRELFRGPWPETAKDADPVPLDKFYRQRGYGALWWIVITSISMLGVVVIAATRNTPF